MGEQHKERRALVMAAEDRYAMPMGVALRSIQENLCKGVTLDVYILDGGIRVGNRRRLIASLDPACLCLHWIHPDDSLVQGLPLHGHIRPAAYYRILSPRLLPPEIDKALYMDCDVVAVGDISPLWSMPFRGAPLQAIQEGEATMASRGITTYEGVDQKVGPEPYLNSGVLVFDLPRWRDEGLCERVLESLRRNHDRVQFWDQDGLNATVWQLGGPGCEVEPPGRLFACCRCHPVGIPGQARIRSRRGSFCLVAEALALLRGAPRV